MKFFFLLSLLMPILGYSETHLDSFKNFKRSSDLSVVYMEKIYHDNGKLCWKDPEVYNTSYSYNDSGIVYYSNGKICWKDPEVYNTSYSYNDSGKVYYSDGKLCWKDPEVYNTSYSYNDSGIVYYPDGKILWKDPEVYNTSYSYNDSAIIYHSNGKILWKDPEVYNTSYSYNDSGKIYHSNGTLCWKDPEVYSDGGKCYDSKGNFLKFVGLSDSIVVDLGGNASAEIWSNGQFELTIDRGDQNYFVRFSDCSFALLQNIGSSLNLYMPLSSLEGIWIFDHLDNWIRIGER